MHGLPLPVVARLLGHSDVRMTMHYAHVGDREIEAAAERVGQAIGAMLAGNAAIDRKTAAPCDMTAPKGVENRDSFTTI